MVFVLSPRQDYVLTDGRNTSRVNGNSALMFSEVYRLARWSPSSLPSVIAMPMLTPAIGVVY